jgi:hypothetical protein
MGRPPYPLARPVHGWGDTCNAGNADVAISNAGLQVLVTQLFADDQDTARADRRKVVVKSIDRLPDLMTKVRREHVTA